MILVTSAAYVEGDLRSEFGPIPPSFLPLGNHSLLKWQAELLKRSFPGEQIILSLPEDFELSRSQRRLVEENEIEIVTVPEGFSLASSILFVLNVASSREEQSPVRILHGDTLFSELSDSIDVVGVAGSNDSYDWQLAQSSSAIGKNVWCGWFSFGDRTELVRSLAVEANDFALAISRYNESIPLHEEFATGWMDLGHSTTYFRARERFTTERSFNNLQIGNGVVTKGGEKPEKLLAEASWFAHLPAPLKKFAPALYEMNELDGSYTIEYLPLAPLNELFVHGQHPVAFWDEIFYLARNWFESAQDLSSRDISIARIERERLAVQKTSERITQFRQQYDFDLDQAIVLGDDQLPSISKMVKHLIELALDAPLVPGVVHGDFCFSNLLFDSRNSRLRLLDPRGYSKTGLQGDQLYDLAKFAHSAVGFYDIIMAGGFDLSWDLGEMEFSLELDTSRRQTQIAHAALNEMVIDRGRVKLWDSLPQMILLFLTMPPLHADDPNRQWALFINGVRLYRDLILKGNMK